jgi:hypothetical protein
VHAKGLYDNVCIMLCDHIIMAHIFTLLIISKIEHFIILVLPINLFKPNFCAYELKDKVLNLLHLSLQPKWAKRAVMEVEGR